MNGTSKKSYYKPSSKNYMFKAIMINEMPKIVVGIPEDVDISSDDIDLILDSQIYSIDIPDYFYRLFRLPAEKRRIIEKIVKFVIKENKSDIIMGKNWEAFISYVSCREELSLSKIVTLFDDCMSDEEKILLFDSNNLIDTFEKNKTTTSFRKTTLSLLSLFCAYNFVTPSFIYSGKGFLYQLTVQLSQEEMERFDKEYKKYLLQKYKDIDIEKVEDFDEYYNIEYFIDDFLGARNKYVKIEMQSMYQYIRLDKTYTNLVDFLLDNI